MSKKRLKKIKQFVKDEWVFSVDLMLDDFKKLQDKVESLEGKIDGYGENLWELKEKEGWNKMFKLIDELKEMSMEEIDEMIAKYKKEVK